MKVADRYGEDAERLRRLADWLEASDVVTVQADDVAPFESVVRPSVVALDYFRLADALEAVAAHARDFARIYAGQIVP